VNFVQKSKIKNFFFKNIIATLTQSNIERILDFEQSIVSLANKRLIYIYIKVVDGCKVSNRKKLINSSQIFFLY